MSEILKLRDFVYEETGMYFPDEKQYYFEPRFRKRMETLGIESFVAYLNFLKRDNGRHQEFEKLMNELTINETSFFRNKPQWDAFKDLVIPEIIKAKENKFLKTLRIWSAGCSSGEEVYTMAMILSEMSSSVLSGWKVEVKGTDISRRVLDIAEKGVYRDYQIRGLAEYYKNKFFDPVEGGHKIKDELRKYVSFSHLNLCDDMGMVFMKGFDIIFCKNVLIYFDMESKKRVIQHFFNSLVMDGFLFVGFSESLYGIDNRFKLIHFPGGMVYKKSVHI